MSISNILMKMPLWYLVILIVISLFYAIRGILEKESEMDSSKFNNMQKVIIGYIQEFLFKVIFTASGFLALFIADYIFSSIKSVNHISTGTAVLLIFLIFWGITGVSGYLTFLVISGRFWPNK